MILAFQTRDNPDDSHNFFKIAILIVFFIVAFRFEVGCDWVVYQYHYGIQSAGVFGDNISVVEPGYWLMLDAVHFLGLPFEVMNILVAVMFFSGFYFLARTQPNPMTVLAIAFPILIFAIPMSAIRQAAAMGFIMFGLVFFVRKKLILFCVMIFIGFLFHTSAITFILMAPFIKVNLSVRNLVLMLPVLIFVGLRLSNLEGVEMATDRYVDNLENNAAGAPYRTLILAATGAFFFLIVRPKWKAFNASDYDMILIGSILMISTFVLVFVIPTIADRFGYYFIIFQALIFARLHFLKIENADFWLLSFFMVILGFFIAWSRLSWQLPYCYAPYQNLITTFVL